MSGVRCIEMYIYVASDFRRIDSFVFLLQLAYVTYSIHQYKHYFMLVTYVFLFRYR